MRAHEEFLASDVLAGRGSATRDEELAATYIASEFLGYGLKPAPGITGYLQVAEVRAPDLDGHASLVSGSLTLEEGKDFRLLISSGETVTGPLVRTGLGGELPNSMQPGAVILATGKEEVNNLGPLIQRAGRAAAAGILVTEGNGAQALTAQWGETRVPRYLAENQKKDGLSLLIVSKEALNWLDQQPLGQPTTLSVHALPQKQPRNTFNAIGYLPGSDPASGTILLSAHLDHLGVGKPVRGDAIYNGANDDAAGTTAVLELAHALAAGPQLRRNVLFLCYGSEEAGELGSDYFGRHSPIALKDIIANLEFEMIGAQDPKMPKDTLLLTGWDRSDLGPALKAHGAKLGPDPYPEHHFFERSDNYQLALQGVVAHTAAGWGTPPTYHQPNDDLAHLDIEFMTSVIQSLIEPMRWLADSNFKPAWTKNGQPKRR